MKKNVKKLLSIVTAVFMIACITILVVYADNTNSLNGTAEVTHMSEPAITTIPTVVRKSPVTSTTAVTTTTNSTTTTEKTTTTTTVTTTCSESEKTTTTVSTIYDGIKYENKKGYLFYEPSMRVHTFSCKYADPSCMEVIGDEIDYARKCTVCNPGVKINTIYSEPDPVIEESYEEGPSGNLGRHWTVTEMTYYSGSYGCYGASGRTLINNYSVACNSVPLGTILYIKSSCGTIDGYYRVDDRGGMGDHVVDIFYSDYNNTPSPFRQLGRVSCEVYIVG